MQASRASSRALKHLAASKQQTRGLRMTTPAPFSSFLTSERPAINLPQDIPGLRSECSKRKLPTTGTKAELIDRLSAHEVANARTFSTAVQNAKRPTPDSASVSTSTRHFNTSRSLKTVGDSSTIDFAYLPDFDPDLAQSPVIRVPILPQTQPTESNRLHTASEVEEPVMIPAIMTVAADSTHIHAPSMSAVWDNTSIDFQGMANTVASKLSRPVEESASMARQVWNGLVDDIFGPKIQGPGHA